jgi:hypothetical protein
VRYSRPETNKTRGITKQGTDRPSPAQMWAESCADAASLTLRIRSRGSTSRRTAAACARRA